MIKQRDRLRECIAELEDERDRLRKIVDEQCRFSSVCCEYREQRDGIEAKLRMELRGHPDSQLWGDAGLIAATMRCVDAHDEAVEQRDEWKAKYIQQNLDLNCELMDPNGTIWDHAEKLERELTAVTEQRDEARQELTAMIEQRDEARRLAEKYRHLSCDSLDEADETLLPWETTNPNEL
jgi:DNA repair exonuclease SbcCD ATPase subunit